MSCAKFGWNWPSGSGEQDENMKSLQTDRQQSTSDHKSSIELSDQVVSLRGAFGPSELKIQEYGKKDDGVNLIVKIYL